MKSKFIKICVIVGSILIFILAFLRYVSPQKTIPFLDTNGKQKEGSIAEIRDIEFNGVSQRILIRGKSLDNPILMHLHGGPGSPDQPFMKNGGFVLEDIFTVVYWEQRGTGASFSGDIPKESMTLNQIVEDGVSITNFLIENFNKEKIYLQGHSWGSVVGATMAHQNPELFHAYIGIGQMANTKLSEQRSFDFTMESSKKAGDENTIATLNKIGRPPYQKEEDWLEKNMIERGLMRKYQEPKGEPQFSPLEIYAAFIFYPEYSIRDKLGALKGDPYSMNYLWKEAVRVNFFKTIPKYNLPVYILQGKYDQTTVTSVAKEYFDYLKAPKKEYFEFENSAHSPQLEEFSAYKKVIQEILNNHE